MRFVLLLVVDIVSCEALTLLRVINYPALLLPLFFALCSLNVVVFHITAPYLHEDFSCPTGKATDCVAFWLHQRNDLLHVRSLMRSFYPALFLLEQNILQTPDVQ